MDLAARILGKSPAQFAPEFAPLTVTMPPPRPPGEPRYVSLCELGISIVIDDQDRATCIQLYSAGLSARYQAFTGEPGFGLAFSDSRARVRSVLGAPTKSEAGGPGRGLLGAYLNPWDRFACGNLSYHVEYQPDASSIRLISIALAGT